MCTSACAHTFLRRKRTDRSPTTRGVGGGAACTCHLLKHKRVGKKNCDRFHTTRSNGATDHGPGTTEHSSRAHTHLHIHSEKKHEKKKLLGSSKVTGRTGRSWRSHQTQYKGYRRCGKASKYRAYILVDRCSGLIQSAINKADKDRQRPITKVRSSHRLPTFTSSSAAPPLPFVSHRIVRLRPRRASPTPCPPCSARRQSPDIFPSAIPRLPAPLQRSRLPLRSSP